MTFWINEHVTEAKELINQWRTNRNVNVLATVDHLEMGSTHAILGLDIGWENKTDKSITIVEIQVVIYKRSEEDVLVRLLPLERFARTDIQRTFQKSPLSQFTLDPKEIHMEHIRFLSHGHLDIPGGTYIADIQVRDTDHKSYTRRTKLVVENKMKYRPTEEWREIMA